MTAWFYEVRLENRVRLHVVVIIIFIRIGRRALRAVIGDVRVPYNKMIQWRFDGGQVLSAVRSSSRGDLCAIDLSFSRVR